MYINFIYMYKLNTILYVYILLINSIYPKQSHTFERYPKSQLDMTITTIN